MNVSINKISSLFQFDSSKCIHCNQCILECNKIQTVNALKFENRDNNSSINKTTQLLLNERFCVLCGQCVNVCPNDSLYVKDQSDLLIKALRNNKKTVVARIDNSVVSEIARLANISENELNVGIIISGLRKVGIKYIMSGSATENLSAKETVRELTSHVAAGFKLPLISSNCPGAVNFCERFYPEISINLSRSRTQQQKFGNYIKTAWSEKMKINPADIFTVNITACGIKKNEAERVIKNFSDNRELDLVLTPSELISLFSKTDIDFKYLAVSKFTIHDDEFDEYQNPFKKTIYKHSKDIPDVFESEVRINGVNYRIASAGTLGVTRVLLEAVQSCNKHYHYVKITACKDGCSSI